MSGLPSGWVAADVDDVLAPLEDGRLIHQGWSPQCDRAPSDSADAWGVLKTTAIQPGQFLPGHNKRLPGTLEPRPHLEVREGDLLVTCAGPRARCGIACLVRRTRARLMMSGKMYRFRVDERFIDARYVEAYLLSASAARAIDQMKTGGSDSGLNLTHARFRTLPIPIAPLAEQHRIVAAIEEAFSKLDAGEAGLRTVRWLLKRMRDAVLAAAVTGRLVPQDPTDTPAAELLAELGIDPLVAREPAGTLAAESLANVGVEPGDDSALPLIPAGWSWATLGQLAHGAGYGTSVKCGYEECGVGVLRIPNIRRGCVDMSDLKRAPASADVGDDMLVAPGDLLLVRTNGSRDLIGRCAPVTRELRCSFASYLIRFRMHLAAVDVEYVSLLLGAPAWRHRLEAGSASSAGQYNLSLRTLEPLPVPVPPIAEQLRIVAEVERQLSDLDACERAIDVALACAAALRRSVLKAAFEGRLVPQDPSDEPASVLLDRIRAEREAAPKPIRRRRAGSAAAS